MFKPLDLNKNIQNILRKEGLTALKNFNNFTGTNRFIVFLCNNKQAKKVIFKCAALDTSKEKHSLKKELLLTNNIHKLAKEKSLNLFVPEYTLYSLEKFPYWTTHEYVEGDIIGQFFKFNSNIATKDTGQKIINSILDLQKITIKDFGGQFPKLQTDIHNIQWYCQQKEKNNDVLNKYITDEKTREKIQKIFSNFDDFQCVATHQDISLTNIIYNKKYKKIYILDWEQFTFDSPARDIAHLWISSWQKKKWRKNLLHFFLKKHTLSKKNIVELFQLSAILEIIYFFKCIDVQKKLKKEMQKQYNKTALNAAIEDLHIILNKTFI